MRKVNMYALGSVVLGLLLAGWTGCGGAGEQADNNLPVRRAKMREVKVSTDRIMVTLENETLDGIEADAKRIQGALKAVFNLFPEEHKVKYQTYNQEAQAIATSLADAAKKGNLKVANKKFREMVPYCGKCHEDCAFMMAPGFPQYED